MAYLYQCPKCLTVNTDDEQRDGLVCVQTECGWDPTATEAANKKRAPKLVLLEGDALDEFHAERAPVGLPDRPKREATVVCAACGGDLPFVVPPGAPHGTSWRCSEACALAIVDTPVLEPQRGLQVG